MYCSEILNLQLFSISIKLILVKICIKLDCGNGIRWYSKYTERKYYARNNYQFAS